jgi:hypothetical protein
MAEDALNKEFAEVIAHSWSDEDFHQKLLADPTGTLAAAGVVVPEGKRVEIVENTGDTLYVVLPERPTELADEELDTVAGGMSYFTPCGTADRGYSIKDL